MKINFLFIDSKPNPTLEAVVRNVCLNLKNHLSLPEDITIEMRNLGNNSYGETVLDPRFKNRFKLNCQLVPKEIIYPTIHELIHLEQIFSKRLSVRRDGSYLWDGKVYRNFNPAQLSYQDYINLPWEQDVAKRQQKLLKILLESEA